MSGRVYSAAMIKIHGLVIALSQNRSCGSVTWRGERLSCWV